MILGGKNEEAGMLFKAELVLYQQNKGGRDKRID